MEELFEYLRDWVIPRLDRNVSIPLQEGIDKAEAELTAYKAIVEAAQDASREWKRPTEGEEAGLDTLGAMEYKMDALATALQAANRKPGAVTKG
jgi:hypothetical protein